MALSGEVPYAEAAVASAREATPRREQREVTEGRPAATFISDLRPSRVATLEAVVASLEGVREVETKDGGRRKVRNGTLRDATGEIALVLWGSEVELVAVGDRIRVVDGWVSDRRGRPQISLGRTGRLEHVGARRG